MRALISVFDKAGLDELAGGLVELGFELVASGGTAAHLEQLGLDVQRVEDLTEVPELLGGRVKTLHPRVHAGILARRDHDEDLAALTEHEIPPFDLVCVNLYPFERSPDVETIDVGGPAMLRAAAKNWEHVAALCRPEQYAPVLGELRERDEVSPATRRRLAAEAFATTAAYDAAIASWLERASDTVLLGHEAASDQPLSASNTVSRGSAADADPLPEHVVLRLERRLELPYGENPHQRAAYYVEPGRPHLLAGVRRLQGKPLSFNNLHDLAGAAALLHELDGPACVIVKHANPCGAAVAGTVEQAYERALACDPVSAYGGVVALDRPVDDALAERLAAQFLEVVAAPEITGGARERLAARASLRLLEGLPPVAEGLDLKRVPGGLLVQDRDAADELREQLQVVAGTAGDEAWPDLQLAWRVCAHVGSNAIVLAREGRTIGICGGQPSRVDAVRIALERARTHGHDPRGAVLASDAFFPFADGPQLALDAGVTALIQPGGSKRDAEVIAAVEQFGAAMVFTGRRHFRH